MLSPKIAPTDILSIIVKGTLSHDLGDIFNHLPVTLVAFDWVVGKSHWRLDIFPVLLLLEINMLHPILASTVLSAFLRSNI